MLLSHLTRPSAFQPHSLVVLAYLIHPSLPMSRFLISPIALLVFGGFSLAPAAEPSLAQLIPADTALVFAIHDLPSQLKAFPESPAGRAWADPEIARFFAPLAANPKVKEVLAQIQAETGYAPKELLAMASGDLFLSVPVSSLTLVEGEPDADFVLAIDVGENEAKLSELIAEQRKREVSPPAGYTTEEYNGVTVHTHASPAEDPNAAPADPDAPESTENQSPLDSLGSVSWALHEGRWFIASDSDLVTGALDALAAGGLSSSLATDPEYLKAIDRSGGKIDALVYLNWSAVYPVLIAAMEAARDPAAGPNSFGIEPVGLVKALGLDAIQALSFTAAAVGDVDRVDGALTYTEARGILALAAYRDGPVARPDWVPASWFNVTSQNFSLPDAYQELERLVDQISPALAGLAQGQIKGFERQLGIDLKRDLIGGVGLSFLSAYALPPGSNADAPPAQDELDQFIGVSLADSAAFERTLETLKAKVLPPGEASPLKKRDYLGRSLFSFEQPGGNGRQLTYAITDGWFLLGIGNPACVESVVQLMQTPNVDESFWQRKEVRDALADVPPGAFSVQHSELAPLLASLAASLVKIQNLSLEPENHFVDPEAVPTREQLSRYFKHTTGYGIRAPGGLYFHAESPVR